jgi:hypothetical protein
MFKPAAVLTALLAASAAANASITIVAPMTNAQEPQTPVPVIPTLTSGAPRAVSFGTATFVINDAMNAMSFQAVVNNIDFTGHADDRPQRQPTAAHIHAGPNVPPATNPVVWGFFGTPFNDTVIPNVVVTPFATGVGGTVVGTWDTLEGQNTTFTAQLGNILAGRAYINFHTTQFPGGEIRGALIAPIPEPETYALMLAGLGAIGWVARRRKLQRRG